jgi:intraflagellar transport protein 81
MDAAAIVQGLNVSPFNKGLSIVTLERKTPGDLLLLLQEILQEIDISQKIDIRDEPPEFTAQRMFDFLWILKYKAPIDPYVLRTSL